jgi:hypothetical protein
LLLRSGCLTIDKVGQCLCAFSLHHCTGVDTFTNAIKDGSSSCCHSCTKGKLDITQDKLKHNRLSKEVAEKLRQIRDDESLSIIQEHKIIKIWVLLKQQLNAELAIARQALLVANLRAK